MMNNPLTRRFPRKTSSRNSNDVQLLILIGIRDNMLTPDLLRPGLVKLLMLKNLRITFQRRVGRSSIRFQQVTKKKLNLYKRAISAQSANKDANSLHIQTLKGVIYTDAMKEKIEDLLMNPLFSDARCDDVIDTAKGSGYGSGIDKAVYKGRLMQHLGSSIGGRESRLLRPS
ncbi:hypothetical protein Tco_0328915 [Tanacetum coccineum]